MRRLPIASNGIAFAYPVELVDVVDLEFLIDVRGGVVLTTAPDKSGGECNLWVGLWKGRSITG